MDKSKAYNTAFYQDQASASYKSGIKLLTSLFGVVKKPSSILDVGCGTGSWLAAAHSLGIEDIAGVENSQSAKDMLMISETNWISKNITLPFDLKRKFDMTISLEVAEHLPLESHSIFVENLIRHSDTILFSAALPYQGGTGHQSENWPAYWQALFAKYDFACFDIIRPIIWNMPGINFWYKQNTMLFIKDGISEVIGLDKKQKTVSPLALIHPEMYLWAMRRNGELSQEEYNRDINYYLNVKDKNDIAHSDTPRYGDKHNNEF